MNREFVILLTAACVTIAGLGVIVGLCLDHGIVAYRRWIVRREMRAQTREIREALHTQGYWVADDSQERQKLEAVATAQDRATRRIVH